MSFTILKKLPPVEDIIKDFPLSDATIEKIEQDREEVKAILEGKDDRILMVVGPCSAWPKEAVFDYAEKLAALNEQVQHALKIVMRVYIQKPRTTKGWTGPVNQPDLFVDPDIGCGSNTFSASCVSWSVNQT